MKRVELYRNVEREIGSSSCFWEALSHFRAVQSHEQNVHCCFLTCSTGGEWLVDSLAWIADLWGHVLLSHWGSLLCSWYMGVQEVSCELIFSFGFAEILRVSAGLPPLRTLWGGHLSIPCLGYANIFPQITFIGSWILGIPPGQFPVQAWGLVTDPAVALITYTPHTVPSQWPFIIFSWATTALVVK